MSISFNQISQSKRSPFFYLEMDNSRANEFSQELRAIIFAQKITGAPGLVNTPLAVSNLDQVKATAGNGSVAAKLYEFFRLNNSQTNCYLVLLDDLGAGVARVGTITLVGSATESGTHALYVGAQLVQSVVILGDSVTVQAAAMAAAINADPTLPITATAAAGVVTWTFKHKGLLGNDLLMQVNYRGLVSGEKTPTGVTVAFAQTTAGSGVPVLTTALSALGDEQFDFILHPFNDTTSLDAFKTLMNDSTGRWAPDRKIYGHVYTAKRDSYSNLIAYGDARNDEHNTIAGVEALVPNSPWEYAGAYFGRHSLFVSADAFKPTQTGELLGILPAALPSRFIKVENEALLFAGIATSYTSGGVVRIHRAITTYQTNAWGQNDISYLDSETMHQSAEFNRRIEVAFTSKYGRHKLGKNGTRFGAGADVVTPSVAEQTMDEVYLQMIEEGKMEDFANWKKNRFAEIDPNNPNRMNFLATPDYVNQLRIFAVKQQFRLNY